MIYSTPILKRAIIFGSSGFIGSALSGHLLKMQGVDVLGYSSSDCDLLDHQNVANALDICDGQTSLIVCSAISPRREDSWRSMVRNIEMVHNICESLKGTDFRSLIFLSSVDVYGYDLPSGKISEGTKLNPMTYYGLSKTTSEHSLGLELPEDSNITILRLPGIYGNGDSFQSVIGGFVDAVLKRGSIKIFGDGTETRDYILIDDLCEIIEQFLSNPTREVVNIVSGISRPIREIAAVVFDSLSISPNFEFPPNSRSKYDLEFDNGKLMDLAPNVKFKRVEEGIKKYITDMGK